MHLFRRKVSASTRAGALAEAREATARLRREKKKLERYRAKKQADPVDRMTTNQWIGGGGA